MSEEKQERETVRLVYFGKKYPKIIQTVAPEKYDRAKEEDRRQSAIATKTGNEHQAINFIALLGEPMTFKFTPFEALDVDKAVAKILLAKAGDTFKNVSDEPGKKDPKPVPQTKGHVGDALAERIPDLDKAIEKEKKAEEGKSLEEIMASRKKKEEEEREAKKEEEVED